MLKLLDIIPIEKKDLSNYKIHFAIGGSGRDDKEPLYELYKKKFKSWQENQNKKNFERKSTHHDYNILKIICIFFQKSF